MNPLWVLRTARLVLTPVGGADLADLRAIKADPRVFAIMLGGVRSPQQTAKELADDIADWGANGFGTWAIREIRPSSSASRGWSGGRTAGALRCASRCGRRHRGAVSPVRRLARRYGSVTSRPDCRASLLWRGSRILPRA